MYEPSDGGDRPADRLSRRHLLSGIAGAGAAGLAGCLDGIGGAAPDPGDEPWTTAVVGDVEQIDFAVPGGRVGSLAFDVGAAITPDHERRYVLASSIEETETSVSITLKPDLEWSNGAPLTAADLGRWAYMYRMGSSVFARVPAVREGRHNPQTAWEAVTDVSWDETTVTVEGRFDRAPAPTFSLNMQVGSRPPTYYEPLWEQFQAAYDDVPWEDEATWETVTDLVDDNIWRVADRNRPERGVVLEDDYRGEGWEAAYSGLWYPYRTAKSALYLTVNDAHPFADRVSHDELEVIYRDQQMSALDDLRSGSLDGWMTADVTESLDRTLPDRIGSFPGPVDTIHALSLNHTTRHLGNRDVRAALMYAIDREAVRDTVGLATRRSVSVPGADLLSDAWLPGGLRDQFRPYEYDPERAAELLEGAGFRRGARGGWRTPEDERFGIEVLTSRRDPLLELAVEGQLQDFGVDAAIESVPDGGYQRRVETGYFVATRSLRSSPTASGRDVTRAGEYVRSITHPGGPPVSGYLVEAVDEAIQRRDDLRWIEPGDDGLFARHVGYDSPEALRAVTVSAPPVGEPEGELQEWPYLYHAVMARSTGGETQREHARICTWLYNYQLPELELLVVTPRVFHDTRSWTLPEPDDPVWDIVATQNQPGGLWAALAWGRIDRRDG